ncbi:MAG: transglycosylase SLT domain-containing protein [Pseudomonadota bacterium]
MSGRVLALILCAWPAVLAAQDLEAQRAAFKAVYPSTERGEWAAVEAHASLLKDYVLWPDLRAAYLRVHGDREAEITEFLSRYGTLKPAREIRYRYALRLARQNRHADFLAVYDAYYAELGEPALDCRAALAELAVGRRQSATEKARKLWLVGRSQNKACDPLFTWMRNAGVLDEALEKARYKLAVDSREFLLARYLARSIDDETLLEANRWLRARGNAEQFLQTADVSLAASAYNDQLAYAARRLATSSPERAYAEWARLRRDRDFEDELELGVARQIALWAARRNRDDAVALIARLSPEAVDDEVRRWRIRGALRNGNWQLVRHTIDDLTPDERNRAEWRYWKALAMQRIDEPADGMLLLSGLARERGYYGFLAADFLGTDYALDPIPVTPDEGAIARLASDPALIRARELFMTGLDGRARSEWDEAVRRTDADTRAQAAILADRWNWHSRAIAAAAAVGQYDDLDLRYPLPHRQDFHDAATEAGINESWTYGIARNESSFMRDIRSSAGAIGLMQLMPATGRQTAREIRLPYRGLKTLTDPRSNIKLGATYLGKMHERFGGNPAVATAAYNAGPLRVSRWLPQASEVDARVWVETIPFNETRSYVRRVLAADIIFAWRLTGRAPRLSDRLPAVVPADAGRATSSQ